jgi:hypothetical protein
MPRDLVTMMEAARRIGRPTVDIFWAIRERRLIDYLPRLFGGRVSMREVRRLFPDPKS